MSKRVFRVKYQTRWSDIREWIDGDSLNVLAADAERAIVAARKEAMRERIPAEKNEGKESKVTGFRLIGVESVVVVDVLA